LPPTGVPLPFVSYGGTALAVFMTMMGIALNVSKR
jgi:cell division protein FtsW